MKKILCAILSLLLVMTGFAFSLTVDAATEASSSSVEGIDILVTDSETLGGWHSFENEGLPAKQLVAMSGHGSVMSLTHSGIMYAGGGWAHPDGNGTKPTNGIKFTYTSAVPYDISDMNYLVFDLYVSHPDKISGVDFYVELTSSGVNDNCENSIRATLTAMKGESIQVGWNRIYLALDSLDRGTGSDTGKPAMDATKWNFMRIYNQTTFDAGEELVLAVDNLGFSIEKYTADLEKFETSFTVLGSDEAPYLVSAASANGTTGRYADKDAKIVYKYPVEKLTEAEQILWTARVYNQFFLEASLDGVNYETVYRYNVDLDTLIESGNKHTNTAFAGWQMSGLSAMNMTFNLTETVKLLVDKADGKLMLFDGESVPAGAKRAATTSTEHVKQGKTSLKTTSDEVRLEINFGKTDVSDYANGYLHMWVYVTDYDNINRGYIELTSSGISDVEEMCWRVQDYIKNDGWNELWLPLGEAINKEAANLEGVNYLRMYTNLNTAGVTADMYFDDIYFSLDKEMSSKTPETSETLYLRIGDAYPYPIIKNEDGTYTEDTERASGIACGSGGQIYASTPVTLSVSYPWGAIKPSVTESISFTLFTDEEAPYLIETASNSTNERWADQDKHFTYAYPVQNIQNVNSLVWTARTRNQLRIDVSVDNATWVKVYSYADEVSFEDVYNANQIKVLGGAVRSYDLTAAVKQIATSNAKTLYLRISDALPYAIERKDNGDGTYSYVESSTLSGYGGNINKNSPVTLTATYDVDASVKQTTREGSVLYRFLPTTSTENTGTTHTNIGTIKTASESPYIVTSEYVAADGKSDRPRMVANGKYYYCDKQGFLLYAFPVEKNAVVTAASFTGVLGAELAISVSDSLDGPWYFADVRTADEIAAGKTETDYLSDILRTVDLSSAAAQLGKIKSDMLY